jgi:hypothetical protein
MLGESGLLDTSRIQHTAVQLMAVTLGDLFYSENGSYLLKNVVVPRLLGEGFLCNPELLQVAFHPIAPFNHPLQLLLLNTNPLKTPLPPVSGS